MSYNLAHCSYSFKNRNSLRHSHPQIKICRFLVLLLKRVRVCCLNKKELIKLSNFFKINQDKINQNKEKFLRIVKRGFNISEGYFSFDYIKSDLESLTKVEEMYPTEKELRKGN